jgi:alanyl-tRNA synthetase
MTNSTESTTIDENPEPELINGINVLIQRVEVPDAGGLKQLAFELKNQLSPLFMVVTAEINGKPQIAVAISEDLVKEYNLHAGNIVRELASHIKGGGGGQPFYATAGGSDTAGMDSVLEAARTYVPEK